MDKNINIFQYANSEDLGQTAQKPSGLDVSCLYAQYKLWRKTKTFNP